MIFDLGDSETVALLGIALLAVAILLGWPAMRRVAALRRAQQRLGKLYWHIITALDRLRDR